MYSWDKNETYCSQSSIRNIYIYISFICNDKYCKPPNIYYTDISGSDNINVLSLVNLYHPQRN